jgi:hypothetical protein
MKPLTQTQIDEILARFPALAYKRNLILTRLNCIHKTDERTWYQNSWIDRSYVKPKDHETYRRLLQYAIFLATT